MKDRCGKWADTVDMTNISRQFKTFGGIWFLVLRRPGSCLPVSRQGRGKRRISRHRSGVLEGSGISGPLESTEGIGLDNGQVVKKVEDGPLLSSALAVGLGKGVTDQELAAIVIVGNGLEEGGKVDVSG